MTNRFGRFWRAPLLNKLHILSNTYYKIKGAVLYRFLFKNFGRGSYIRKPLLLLNTDYIEIGNNVAIRDGARLEVVPRDLATVPRLTIGDHTNIEQNVHIVCCCSVSIGCDVSVTGNCSIVDVTHPYEDVDDTRKIGARIDSKDSFVEIGNGAFIGFASVILPNVRVGRCAVVGANSVVNRDIPDYSVAAGIPAIVLKQYDFKNKVWVELTATHVTGLHK